MQTANKNCFSCDKPASQFSEIFLISLYILTCQLLQGEEYSIAPRTHYCLISRADILEFYDQNNVTKTRKSDDLNVLFDVGSTKEVTLEVPVFV